MGLDAGLRGALQDAVGADQVLLDEDRLASYETDWTGRFHGRAAAVVRPVDTDEVAAVVEACRRSGTSMTLQGGNTGLVGGAVPADGAVLVSLRRLTAIGPVDPDSAQVSVGAGVTLGDLQRHLAPSGLQPAVDLAARDSATVGGMAATNAGGLRVLRHGSMRAQVAGIEAVLGSGSVVSSMRGLAKDTSGYDLPSLLVGSEGTLGVITAVRLTLEPVPARRAAALVGVAGLADAVAVAAGLRDGLSSLQAAEVIAGDLLALVDRRRHLGPALTVTPPWALLVECAGPDDDTERLAAALAAAGDRVLDAAVTGDGPRRRALWAHRELVTEVLAEVGPPRKLDVGLPLRAVARFAAEVGPLVDRLAPGATAALFGHLLDGNLHCNLLGVPDGRGETVDGAVLELAVGLGGSIGAEHGIGRAKRRYLPLVHGPAELTALRALKGALDPDGILNPGVLFPDARDLPHEPGPTA